jgi:Uma2 family endonuclease
MMSNAPVPLVTWDDFVNLPEDDRRELIDGRLVETEVATELHEWIVMTIGHHLYQWVVPRGGIVLSSGYKLKISEARGVMPDLQVYLRGNKAKRTPVAMVGGHPDLAVEVVSQHRNYDRVVKLRYYASIGVPEYWLVDPAERSVLQLVLEGGRYAIDTTAVDIEEFAPSSFQGLIIPLAGLWELPTL